MTVVIKLRMLIKLRYIQWLAKIFERLPFRVYIVCCIKHFEILLTLQYMGRDCHDYKNYSMSNVQFIRSVIPCSRSSPCNVPLVSWPVFVALYFRYWRIILRFPTFISHYRHFISHCRYCLMILNLRFPCLERRYLTNSADDLLQYE